MSASIKHPAGENFPRGKLNGNDEGSLQFKVGHDRETVVIDFGKEVVWVGMDGDTAAQLGLLLIQHARAVGLTKPLTMEF